MNAKRFIEIVKTDFLNEFPNSHVTGKLYEFLGVKAISFSFRLGLPEEWINHIPENDVLSLSVIVKTQSGYLPGDFTEDSELPEIKIEFNRNTYRIATHDKFMYCASKKIAGARATKGNPEKIIKKLESLFAELKISLAADLAAGNLVERDAELIQKKIS